MSARILRVGLVVPSSNTVMEPDFHRQLDGPAIVSTARIFLEDVTREAETRMLEDALPHAVDAIRTTAPDITVFGCTSAGALGRLAHDCGIAEQIRSITGAPVVTVLSAVLERVRQVAPKRLAVFTPYLEDLTQGVGDSLAEGGFAPVTAQGMGIQANLEIGRVTPREIVAFVEPRAKEANPDCVFLSCTNWQAIAAIEELQQRLGVRVLTSNQSAIDTVKAALKGLL